MLLVINYGHIYKKRLTHKPTLKKHSSIIALVPKV